ncbi:hypothetical protein [Dyadobacter sp. Leaf189]|uniref:hypothetical protein n=1 Tax=Dyadobacter sp. Leaf189 TaxID=1736295 RepID=UPI0006F8B6B5|nr:hypothetical protein [Dyadobacter sp. Leaf189]KQS25328.1 hypothetical protein ASG33_21690 [Dyadobacter sp. Leaf189]
MKGISYLIDEIGEKKAVVIDVALLREKDSLSNILEDIEDEIAIELRKDEESLNWKDVKDQLLSED